MLSKSIGTGTFGHLPIGYSSAGFLLEGLALRPSLQSSTMVSFALASLAYSSIFTTGKFNERQRLM